MRSGERTAPVSRLVRVGWSRALLRCGWRPGRARVVEVDHEPVLDDTRPTGRIWKVQLQRDGRIGVIATDLGRPSADHLANQIDGLLNPRQQAHRVAID